MEKEILIAPLFTKVADTDEMEIFIPTRIIFGITDDDEYSFFDVVSQSVYYDINCYSDEGMYSGFDEIKPLSWLLEEFPELNLFESVNAYFNRLKENVYYFKIDSGKVEDFLLKSMPVAEFNSKYNVNIKYPNIPSDLNELNIKNVIKEYKELAVASAEQEENATETTLPNITEVYNEITKHVLCQNTQVRRLLTAIYKHIIFKDKANVLMYGPSGVGKTAILNQISHLFGLPMVIEDSTSYTISGYTGDSCKDALRHLYEVAGGNLTLAEHGILVFDEIDKKNKKNSSDSSGIASEGVLHSLLKIVEGGVFEVELGHHTGEKIMFDTSNLIVIVGGAFEDMLKKENSTSPIGFNTINQVNNLVNTFEDEAGRFMKYGMPKEFVGRFNIFIKLNDLTKDDLKNILINSEFSVLKKQLRQLKDYGINVTMTDELIDKICELAMLRRTGARALNNIVNDIFEETFYKLFENTDIKSDIVLDKDIINNDKKLVLKNTVQGN